MNEDLPIRRPHGALAIWRPYRLHCRLRRPLPACIRSIGLISSVVISRPGRRQPMRCIRMAWAKLIWLMAFLATLLAISYLVPYIAERTQYAITSGKQRAEHDFARKHLGESPIGEMSRAYQMVSQLVGPSVVHINTTGGTEGSILPLSTRRSSRMQTEGQGSGVIMDASGYILTNNHVIRGASDIQVSLADGRKLQAEVIGKDGPTDLAVLRIKADNLVPAEWGDSEMAEPGCWCGPSEVHLAWPIR